MELDRLAGWEVNHLNPPNHRYMIYAQTETMKMQPKDSKQDRERERERLFNHSSILVSEQTMNTE